jgi:hypothetical protein
VDKVIGLGSLGCAVAEDLSQHPEYRIYKIDSLIEERGSLSLGALNNMEAHEKNVDSVEVAVYLRSIRPDDEVLCVVGGGDPVAGAILRILETIKDAKISILYICPERTMSSEIQKRDDKIAFNVLQEYARSGVLERIFLVDQSSIEELMEDAPVHQYHQQISHFISHLVAMINYFNHTNPVLSSRLELPDMCRIATFGVSSLEGARDVNFLFPLEPIAGLHFYYGIPEKQLETDTTLIKRIKEHVKDFKNAAESVSYSIHPTTYDRMMVLCLCFSVKIQLLCDSQ